MDCKIVKQKDTYDCGIASIAMILEYYKVSYEYEEILYADVINSGKGATFQQLREILSRYGFVSEGYVLALKDFLDMRIKRPMIAHICVDSDVFHYVVIFSEKNKELLIGDPARGMLVWAKEQMYKMSTGYFLQIGKESDC